jgi:hypothetical protein
MKRERLSIQYGGRDYDPEDLAEHLANKRAWAQLAARRKKAQELGIPQPRNERKRTADPTVARLMRTIAQCKEQEKQAWAMLSTYLATGRTIVRLRLEDPEPAVVLQNGGDRPFEDS